MGVEIEDGPEHRNTDRRSSESSGWHSQLWRRWLKCSGGRPLRPKNLLLALTRGSEPRESMRPERATVVAQMGHLDTDSVWNVYLGEMIGLIHQKPPLVTSRGCT